MRSDELEFLIAQYADGTLDSEQTPEVEAILRRNELARQMLESYRSLDRVLSSTASPEIRWDRLEDRISRQVAGASIANDPAASVSEEVEEQISRLAEGNSSPAESRLIEARLSADPQARLLLSEYASLERLFEAVRARPLPAVRWHKLNDHIAQALGIRSAEAERPARAAVNRRTTAAEETGVLARIGNWLRTPQRMAIAACLLVAGAVGIRLISNGNNPAQNGGPGIVATPANPGPVATANPAPGVIDVKGPTIGGPANPAINQDTTANRIQVGPPRSGVTPDPSSFDQTCEASANRGGTTLIAPGKSAGQDRDAKASRDSGWPFSR